MNETLKVLEMRRTEESEVLRHEYMKPIEAYNTKVYILNPKW